MKFKIGDKVVVDNLVRYEGNPGVTEGMKSFMNNGVYTISNYSTTSGFYELEEDKGCWSWFENWLKLADEGIKNTTGKKPITMNGKYETRDGRPVRILATDLNKGGYTVAAAVSTEGGWLLREYTEFGEYVLESTAPRANDIVEVVEYEWRTISDFMEDGHCRIGNLPYTSFDEVLKALEGYPFYGKFPKGEVVCLSNCVEIVKNPNL